jgi:UMF1 family MFS transporter
MPENTGQGWWGKLGIGGRPQRAWALYDWANSAFITIVVTAVYPIWFQRVAAAGAEGAAGRHAMASFWSLLTIALMAPFLGAVADLAGGKKRFLGAFLALGVLATAGLAFVPAGSWALASALFILANIGVTGSFVFYDSLLPHVASDEEIDRVSTAGYGLGYLGGGLLLALALAAISFPQRFGLADSGVATRVAFFATAVWWAGFAIPLFRHVPEPEVADRIGVGQALRGAVGRLVDTARHLGRYREAFLMLVAAMVYLDGVGTIYRMGTTFGAELGLPETALITAILLVQFLGIPFAFLFGAMARRIGAKRAILVGIAIYLGISVYGYFVQTLTQFFILAGLVATVQGGVQALSRSLFASMIPRDRSSEFFGLFAIFERFAGMFGALVFAQAIAATGSSRVGVLAVVVFFAVGGVLLSRVDEEAGRAAAER